jgi:hypothetical protein
MSRGPQFSAVCVNAEADAVIALLSNGYLRIYDGVKPATADTAIGSQVLLAELRFATPAAPAASGGLSTFTALTADASANATGTASWFRALKSDGTTVVFDGTVGSGAVFDLILVSTSIVITQSVALDNLAALRVSKGA